MTKCPISKEPERPIIDDWHQVGERMKGFVSGDPRWPGGGAIITSPVWRVDVKRGLMQTQNSTYRLGYPRHDRKPVLRAALQSDWQYAFDLLVELSKPLTPVVGRLLKAIRRADDQVDRRAGARRVESVLRASGRQALADAWALLSVDPKVKDQCSRGAELLYDEFDAKNAIEKRVAVGWESLAKGDHEFVDGELTDPIAAAHEIGARTVEANEQSAAKNEWPLALRVAAAPHWYAAADILVSSASPDDARLLGDAGLIIGAGPLPTMRRIARAARIQSRLSSETFSALILLSARPDDQDDIERSAAMLEEVAASEYLIGDRDAQRVVRAWRGLRVPDVVAGADDLFELAYQIVERKRESSSRIRGDDRAAAADEFEDLPPGTGVVVLRAVGGGTNTVSREAMREWKPLVGRRLPLAPAPVDLAAARCVLAAEFPYAGGAVDALLSDLVGLDHLRLRPTLLLGEPGGGKSRLARRLAEELRWPLARFDGASSSDNSFAGTARRWNSGEASVPARAIKDSMTANPLVIVDEIDKCGTDRRNGRLWESLLPLLESETAARHADQYLQAPVDLSHVSFIATGNDDTVLPAPLKDRFQVLRIGRLRQEHVPAVAARILRDLAREQPGDDRFIWPLDGDEIEIAARLIGDGSIRRLREIVRRLLAAREAHALRH